MLKGLNVNETRAYVSKLDPDKENPTKFLIGILDPQLRDELEDSASEFELSSSNPDDRAKVNVHVNKRDYLAVRFGLKGLENFLDPQTGKPVPYQTEAVHFAGKMRTVAASHIIAMFPRELRKELAEVILKENFLSESETKN